MDLDETLLQRVLGLPSSAIADTMGLELTRLVTPRVVLELPGNEIDVAAFEQAGHCESRSREGIHNQTVATWVKRGELLDHRGTRR